MFGNSLNGFPSPGQGRNNWEKVEGDFDPQNQLDRVPAEYFEAIGSSAPEEIISFRRKMKPLVEVLPFPKSIATIGVGSGIELQALSQLYSDSNPVFYGIDVSGKAITAARRHLELSQTNLEQIKFVHKNAAAPDGVGLENVDAFILSSVLHEIFSYTKDGRGTIENSLSNIFTSLQPEGLLFIRDFASPIRNETVNLHFKNEAAADFYRYFSRNFRRFMSWEDGDREIMQTAKRPFHDYPIPANGSNIVALDSMQAAEMMLHFRNYIDHINRGMIQPGDVDWKELDEVYILPNIKSEANVLGGLVSEDIPQLLIDYAKQKGVELELEHYQRTFRPQTASYLSEHFGVSKEGDLNQDNTRAFLLNATSKFEVICRKISS